MRLLKEIRNLLDNYHVKSGIYHYYRSEFDPAVEFFKKALDSDEELIASDRRVAKYYLTMTLIESAERRQARGDLEAAAEQYARALEVSPTYPDIHYRYGGVLERLQRNDDAVRAYRKAIECNETYLDAWVALGFCLLGQRRRDEAGEAFRQACEIKLHLTQGPFDDGIKAIAADDFEGAVAFFHEAFVYVPQMFEQRRRAAVEHLKAEQYEEALEEFDAAIELSPRYPDLYNFRGLALCELGRVEEAIDEFRRSSELNPRFMVPRLNLAFSLLRAGRFKEAEVQLEEILKDDPTEPAARAKLQELQSGVVPEKRRSVNRGGR